MMNNKTNGQRFMTGQSDIHGENEIKKYLRIFEKRKWLVIITTFLVFILWTIYVVLYDSKPVYTTGTLLSFQDQQNISAVADRGRTTSSSSRATLLETNRLLGEVVRELKFNLSIDTDGIEKRSLFEFLDVPESSQAGKYKLIIKGAEASLMYKNPKLNTKERKIIDFNVSDTVHVHNFRFKLNPNYALNFTPETPIEFKVRLMEAAIASLKSLVSYRWVDGRTRTNLIINATHSSPSTAALIANTMAEKFVQLDLKIRRRKTEEVLKILNEQLQVAKDELDEANRKLQNFKERYPWVMPSPTVATGGFAGPRSGVTLTPGADSPIGKISVLKERKNLIESKIVDLNRLENQLATGSELNGRISNAREVLTYLLSEGIPLASAYDLELTKLAGERTALMGQYALSHPLFRENDKNLNNLFAKILEISEDHIEKLKSQIKTLDDSIVAERLQLRRLPQKEKEAMELIIDQGVKRDLYQTILAKANEAKIKHEVQVGDVFILDKASVPPEVGKMFIILKKAIMGLFLGLGLGLALAFIANFFDKTVQDSDELQSKLSLPILGSIPVINQEGDREESIRDTRGKRDTKLITLDYSPTLESESYRDLRTKLLFKDQNRVVSSFLVTSLGPSEGKSLTSSNLAITFAQQKISTVLVDGDLRRGVLHNVFGNKKKPGLSDFLVSKATLDYENVSKLVQKTFIPNLYLVSTGSPIPNPTELLGSERMQHLLTLLKSRFGMVIIDTAPFQASSDSAILSTNIDGAVIVVRAEYTNVDQLNRKLIEYDTMQQKILGIVLNMVKVDMKKERYQYSYYNY